MTSCTDEKGVGAEASGDIGTGLAGDRVVSGTAVDRVGNRPGR